MIRVFIGYDSRETVAYGVLAHSINARATEPVAITPVMLSQLQSVFRREKNPLQSTEFSFTRFLVPWMCGYEGWALFMDCDMLMREDVARLWKLRDDRYAVQVVKHEHVPKEDTKFLGSVQTRYPKKNWSSVMLMNCAKCRALTPDLVNQASGLELHQFKWIGNDELIGAIASGWNHLAGYDAPRRDASLVHFTIGGPWFDEYRETEYASEWFAERERMLTASRREKVAAAS
ncbi:MAG: glycosyltransferase [Pseudomonadota bacterium]|nr:glycosyltransferase [Pseudomonadota bacterium]